MMKLNKLAASCALAMAALSGQAYALTAFDAPDLDVYMSGASAPQNILSGVANQLFDSAQGIFVFYDDAGTASTFDANDGKNYRTYFGVVKAGSGVPASLVGKKVMLQNRAKGGSVFGVDPVARAQGIANMKVSAASCVVAPAGSAYNYACATQGEDTTHATALPNRVPDFGVSDVEPNMFKFPYNVEPGAAQLSPAEAAIFAGTQFGTNAVMFGLPVTTQVPAATYISKADFGGMLNGDVQYWEQVDASLNSATVGSPLAGAGSQVVVCRRVQGSGTQATYNNLFSHFPCENSSIAGTGTIKPAAATDSASIALGTATGSGVDAVHPILVSAADGYTVAEGAGSGDVRSCLTAAQNGGLYSFQAGDGKYYKVNFGTGQFGAVGVLSMDSAGLEAGWSFRSLDGVAPTKQNMLDVKYDLVSEQSMQYRNTLPAGIKKDFINLFIKKAGDPNILLAISKVAVRDSVAAVPVNGNDPTTNSNVMRGTRVGNSCSPIRKQF